MTTTPTLGWIQQEVTDRGFVWFERGLLNVNIVGVRNPKNVPGDDSFNDWLTLSYRTIPGAYGYPWPASKRIEAEGDGWCFHAFPATLDPGVHYLLDPMNELGTAIIAGQQARSAYRLGLHRGDYPALVQAKPVKYWRDSNLDTRRDHTNLQESVAGLNIHHASKNDSTSIGRYSAGCTVLPKMADWNLFLAIVKRSAEEWGEYFTYTVLD